MNRIPTYNPNIENQTLSQNSAHLREHIGLVTNDTSTTQLCFLISPLKDKACVEKTEYVVLDHPTYGDSYQVIAEITDIRGYEEVVGGSITDKTAGNMVATAQIIGYINQQEKAKPMRPLLTPPNPGSRVYIPYVNFLEDTFTRDADGQPYGNPICVGDMEATAQIDSENKRTLKFYLDAKTITNANTLITAKDGAGKTHTARIITEEIAQKTQYPIVILDPYNEYIRTGERSSRHVQSFLLNQEKIAEESSKLVKNNTITILNAQNLSPEERQATFVNYVEALWNARIQKKVSPFLLIIEDAETFRSQLLDTVAYEGNKNGIALILIAKHPVELGGRVITQTNTQIMGRTNDKEDLETLKNMAQEKTSVLPNLRKGQWVVNSIDTIRPIQIKARESVTP
jgi:DNA helicase HerA-like ATPase